ncbi:MAG: efflux RND transporter periplasmic adaptor subunit [Phycisphaerae bacterium]|nr:efflux RND transporter periplasmic adaptor subunit [Phycisphaerae bacterium]
MSARRTFGTSRRRIEPLDKQLHARCGFPRVAQQVHRRSARATLTVVLVVVALAGGGIGGYALSHRLGTGPSSSDMGSGTDATAADGDQWYTCGMHPNVLQKGPGDCPICHMKLTPLKKGDDTGSGAKASKERKVLYWRAPMDPNYISEKPGKSPMGMDLVPVYADEEESGSAHTIRIDPVTTQNMGIRTATVKRGPLIKTIRTVGRIDYNEPLVTFVDTKFNGWIEKLGVDETGQHVERGQLLFSVYSPELYAAQQEYLSAVQTLPRLEASTFAPAREEAVKMVEAALTKLKYLDVSDEQVETLRATGKIEKTLAIHSPASGIVTEKMALEGMYIKPGMRLYTIADLSRVWVYVDVYEYQLPWISVGQNATMTLPYVPGEGFVGKVVYIYPYLEPQTRVIKVRLEFENADMQLKPGMYANIRLESELQRDAILVPRESYIDSGTRQVAFVDLGGGKFAPRDVQVGVEAEDGMVEVLYGLDEGEIVVTSGQFMLDAESKLKEAVAKMMEAERAKTTKRAPESGGHAGHSPDQEMAGMHEAPTMPEGTAYSCPMEKHPDETDPANQGPYFSDKPGQCPHCGMKLKPIGEFSWADKYKAGTVASSVAPSMTEGGIPADAQYACPMDRHPDETDAADQGPYFSAEAGKCPRCGMKLKPLDDLEWIRAQRAADGGEVAYTCPDHQHVFSDTGGECPRCGRALAPFKVMYTCPDPEHASAVSATPGNCPHCGRGMAAYRGVWLDEKMASENVPASPGLADVAPYRCPIHPLVHSDKVGRCTICGSELASTSSAASGEALRTAIPLGAKYTCSMKICWHFAAEPGECPKCGMRLKPIEEVAWAKDLLDERSVQAGVAYACPMHPQEIRSAAPGTCSICGMQLVPESALKRPVAAPEHVAAQVDYIMEHYLELQRLLASDRTKDLTLHALGLVSASETLSKHISEPGVNLPPEAAQAAKRLHAAALKITGKLETDRVTFVELSAAVSVLVEYARPDKTRWPKLYLYHCPMSKGDWLQPAEEKANPYYGFKMLNCGELRGIK